MSRSTFAFSRLTGGVNPQTPDQKLPDSAGSNEALKAEIEATLSDCENALRRLSAQLRN